MNPPAVTAVRHDPCKRRANHTSRSVRGSCSLCEAMKVGIEVLPQCGSVLVNREDVPMELGRRWPLDRQAVGVFLLHEGAAQAARQYHAPLEAAEVSPLSKENAAVFTAVRQPGGGLQRV